ncbi:hypothetical protein TNCV_235231 [Trichonephila clavipes]|uniref:Uncharacterized protein n=1 Tax=Trichonephila clavipes TaxID=2585209 RepID=A0A8X6SY35_TRICX|nr:hypothetical protein TNCV_235231 [Trichonephila clavipes]
MSGYELLGHMEEIENEAMDKIKYCIPHHFVYRPNETSTPLTVVFDKWSQVVGYLQPLYIEDVFLGSGSLVVKVTHSWLSCLEFQPSTTEDPLCRLGPCMVNMSRLKCTPVGVMWGNGCQLRCHPRHLTVAQNHEIHHQIPLALE